MRLLHTCHAAGVCREPCDADRPVNPQDLANSLQKKYDTIRDFSADFVHTYEGGVLRRKREERGTLFVKKPGKMRWNYKAPDEKVFVSDGVRLIQYLPEENRAIVSGCPTKSRRRSVPAGRGNLTRDFNVSLGQGGPPDAWALRLEPKKPQQDTTGSRSPQPGKLSCCGR